MAIVQSTYSYAIYTWASMNPGDMGSSVAIGDASFPKRCAQVIPNAAAGAVVWQGSLDNVNWNDLDTSSLSLSRVLENTPYRYIRPNYRSSSSPDAVPVTVLLYLAK